jgi:hypothetical protein
VGGITIWRKNEQKIQPKRKLKDICIQHPPKKQAKKLFNPIRQNGNDLPKECSSTTPQKQQGSKRTGMMGEANIQR